jgi:transcriptional regulator GlxA family with amidase domain
VDVLDFQFESRAARRFVGGRPDADARAWTLQELARASGVSRTVLTERFTRFLGAPPLAYLAHWRLQMGARLLRTTNRKVLDVAGEVGYESKAAFNRAFKRAFGTPPARYRREGNAARRG